MLALYIVGGIFGYLGIGGMVGGYYSSVYKPNDEPRMTALDRLALLLLSVFFWPAVIAIWSGKDLGNKIGDYRLTKKKERAKKKEEQKRIAEKMRIEIDTIIQEEVEAELKQNHVA